MEVIEALFPTTRGLDMSGQPLKEDGSNIGYPEKNRVYPKAIGFWKHEQNWDSQ